MGKCLSCLCNCLTASILLTADALVSLLGGTATALVDCIDFVSGSGYNTVRKKIAWHEPRYLTKPVYRKCEQASGNTGFFGELDEAATLKASEFPISAGKLIELARAFMQCESGTNLLKSDFLAEDFQIVAPIYGPASKAEFTRIDAPHRTRGGFPDLSHNGWFEVDPLEPNRVWFFNRATATHTGVVTFPSIRSKAPTGKSVYMPPQAFSMLFNEQGKLYSWTVGFPMDKRIGNSHGLGLTFGMLKAVGKPIPFVEANSLYVPSLRYEAIERIGKAAENAGFDPVTGTRKHV